MCKWESRFSARQSVENVGRGFREDVQSFLNIPLVAKMVVLAPQVGVFDFQLFGPTLRAAAPFPPWGRQREAPPSGTESLGMDAQLRGHFRGRSTAGAPKLNGLAFEGFIELLSRLLGLDHRFTHTR